MIIFCTIKCKDEKYLEILEWMIEYFWIDERLTIVYPGLSNGEVQYFKKYYSSTAQSIFHRKDTSKTKRAHPSRSRKNLVIIELFGMNKFSPLIQRKYFACWNFQFPLRWPEWINCTLIIVNVKKCIANIFDYLLSFVEA